MKTTLSTTYRNLLQELGNSNSRLEKLRLQAATGKKMVKPSDDPSGIRPVLNARGQIRGADRYLRTMGTAMDRLNSVDSTLGQVESLMQRAKENLVGAGNGSLGPADLATYADQIRNIKEELISLGNSQVDGKYMFSGYEESTPPFSGTPVSYNGDNGKNEMEIGPGAKVSVNLTGNALFMGDFDGDGVTDADGVNIFDVLGEIENALKNGDPASALAQMELLDRGADQTRNLRGEMGNIAQRVENSMLNMEDIRIDMKEILSRYEDTDILETLTNLTQQETAFQAALQVTSQVSRLSILDYMR